MRIFIIGSGGREHALAWKILQSSRLTQLYINSPNASLESLKKAYPQKSIIHTDIQEDNLSEITDFAVKNNIDIAVIGSEAPLSAGLSDQLRDRGIKTFGPSRTAAEIETSKAFAKDFMERHGIPTAQYAVFNEFSAAFTYIQKIKYPIVIKASGLAGGKGVFLPDDIQESKIILERLLVDNNQVIIEERLEGEEISLLAFTDGVTIKPLPLARDYKRVGDANTGPNTGGMGAYAPVKLPIEFNLESLITEILEPVIKNLREENRSFTGVLYAGLMLTAQGVRVLEFNCRLGDPETQVLLPLLSSDLIDIMEACIENKLSACNITWKDQSAVCIVLASEGYPEYHSTEQVITGLDNHHDHTVIFHAGTRKIKTGEVFASGGRVLGITAWADSLEEASKIAYQRVSAIHYTGIHYRHDIAQQKENKLDVYANAGVNIAAGNHTVALMTKAVRSTYGKEVLAGIGAFGGMYHATQLKEMNDPVLVASTDGIGTKVHLGVAANRLASLGYDIVHHSVNDILVQGAKPLFFLDYIASSKLEPTKIAEIVTGMAEACRTVGCALLGGETAEMPGVYLPNMVDVAGTIVGIVERAKSLPHSNIQSGDILLGLSSSGPHTNGYSLIRKIFADVDLETVLPELNISLADALLAPHRCYLSVLETALNHSRSPIKGLVHITGGGFFENIPRILPEGLSAQLKHWPVPNLFKLIQNRGNIDSTQMYHIFNMGIGMVIITAPENVILLESLINETILPIGKLVPGEKQVIFV